MWKIKRTVQACVVIGVWMSSMACSITDPVVGKPIDSLYHRLGGKAAIVKVIDEFVGNVSNDFRINRRFATTNIPRLKAHLVDQVCAATGGPCTYSGRDMITTHRGMGITNAEFSALVKDLVAALDSLQVPKAEQTELLNLLGPMKSDIVEIPG